MKGIILFSAALFCALACQCQVTIGFFGGPLASSASYSVQSNKQETAYQLGFQLGGGVKIPFDNQLSFTPDISYRLMGYKVTFNTPSFPPDLLAKNNNTRFHEVDISVPLQVDFSKKPSHLFIKGGAIFGFILAGNEKFDLQTGETVDRSMKFSVLNSYGRYGAGAIVQFGFETGGGFIIHADYVQHLMSMDNQDNGPTIRNYLFGIAVGKFFRGKK